MRKYTALTNLEVKLFRDVDSLLKKIGELNGFLRKANGYGTSSISYTDYLREAVELEGRFIMNTSFIDNKAFKEIFEVKYLYDGANEKDLFEKSGRKHNIKPLLIKFIMKNLGKQFKCIIRTSNINGHCDIVDLIDYDYSLPITLFNNITPLQDEPLSVHGICSWLGHNDSRIISI